MIALALGLPVLGLPLAWRAPTAVQARRWVSWLALLDTAVWVGLLLLDGDARLGRFGAGGAPVAIGTWLLLASISWPARRWPLALTVVAAGLCAGGASLLAGGGDLSDATGALALAAAVVVVAARSERDGGVIPAVIAAAGTAMVAVGLVRLEHDTGGFASGGGAVVAIGAAAVVLASGARARRAGVVLLPLALVLGVQADVGTTVGIVVAVVAVFFTGRPGASLGLWAVAAAAVSPPAALLIGSGAVVTAAWLHPLAPLAALPGAAAVVFAGSQDGSAGLLVLAFLAAETLRQLWRSDDAALVDATPSPPTIAAIALGAWLLLAPETWAWADAAGLDSWGRGVVVALVAAAIGAFVVASFTDAPFGSVRLEVADPSFDKRDPRWAWPAAIASLVILAITGGALVASVAS